MKRILITGKNSYIGLSLIDWLKDSPEKYSINSISLKDNTWKEHDFAEYDVIFHVAGIAHVSTDPSMEESYYKINCDLAIETAKKAKKEGVKQFVFMSSIIVYGDSSRREKVISSKTIPSPSNFYGNSKLRAEKGICALESQNFKVAIIRPPMIYGNGSKGNYKRLSNISKKTAFFPDLHNQRSMLHIDNLCEFLRLIIENEESGLFFPQNKEYVSTKEMVKLISSIYGKKIIFVKIFNPIINLLCLKINIINKVFGNLVYEKSMSKYKMEYQLREFEESILLTELEK